MPNGEASNEKEIIEIRNADRTAIGMYKCSADNHVGTPDTREVEVSVICKRFINGLGKGIIFNVSFSRADPPEVELERRMVHTGIGFEVQLICVIHAEPPANIHWFFGTAQLATTERHSQQNHGSRYSLHIRNVTIYDLGNYTCQATNKLGRDRKVMTLTGIPAVCVFDSVSLFSIPKIALFRPDVI